MSSADYRKLSDEALIHRFVHRNDQITINVLFERYGHLVLGLCMKYLNNAETAQDATRQIFIKLLDDLHQFQIENFRSWLFQATKNFCLMKIRKGIEVVNNEFVTYQDMENDDAWSQKMEEANLYEKLETAIIQLNASQRTCIELFYLHKMTYKEIAAKTKYSLQDVKNYLQQGKLNLKIRLETLTGGVRK